MPIPIHPRIPCLQAAMPIPRGLVLPLAPATTLGAKVSAMPAETAGPNFSAPKQLADAANECRHHVQAG